ncbi:MAG: type IV pilus modification protein PilV [Gammaproteobacteria bacterium]
MTRAKLPRSAQGFTLLEVLVAVLVLSLGLLGLAALQSAGLRQNHSAYHRSQATLLAYDIIDRMRANKVTAEADGYVLAKTSTPPSFTVDCITTSCLSGADLAAFELNDWIGRISQTLPMGQGEVAPLAAGIVTVTVAWDDNHSGAANQQFAMSTQL